MQRYPASNTNAKNGSVVLVPARFIACVRRPESAERLRKEFSENIDIVTILTNDNVRGVQLGDVIILGCKPYAYQELLGAPGIRDALCGKIMISILGGIAAEKLEETLYGPISSGEMHQQKRCTVMRAIPNTASTVGESMTVIPDPELTLPQNAVQLVRSLFLRIGRIKQSSPALVDAATAVCASSPAFFALMLEAVADGACEMGISREDALEMAAGAMRGVAELVSRGELPSALRRKVAVPGGSTMVGLKVLEKGRVRDFIAESVKETTTAAKSLGVRSAKEE